MPPAATRPHRDARRLGGKDRHQRVVQGGRLDRLDQERRDVLGLALAHAQRRQDDDPWRRPRSRRARPPRGRSHRGRAGAGRAPRCRRPSRPVAIRSRADCPVSNASAVMPQRASWAVRMRRLVALSSTTRAWRPARSTGTSGVTAGIAAAGTRMVRRNVLPRPATPVALDPDVAVHELGQAPRDGESQAGPAVAPRDRGVGLAERLEQPPDAVWRDADARVADADGRPSSGRRRGGSPPTVSSTSPCSVNLTALDSRLRTIWRSRPSSPMIARGSASSMA